MNQDHSERKEEEIKSLDRIIEALRSNLYEGRNFFLVFVILSILLCCGIIISSIYYPNPWLICGLIVSFLIATGFLISINFTFSFNKDRIEQIEYRKRIIAGLPEKPNYFESLVNINIENLGSYYRLVKTHTSHSFKVALVVCVTGFILIGIGLAMGFTMEKETIGYITSATGIIIEFISGVLFYLYNRTVRQLKEYHDSLIGVQNILLSFKLIESVEDDKIKAETIGKMIEYLIQKK